MILLVKGRPFAKQRARTVNGHTYTPPRTREYEELVAWSCRGQSEKFPTGDVAVLISLFGKRKLTGDIDNYAKSLLDGIVKGGVLGDDRQVVHLSITKASAEDDHAIITIVRV